MSVSRLAQAGDHCLPLTMHLRVQTDIAFPASVELPVIHTGHLQKLEGAHIFQSEWVGGSAHQGRKAGETQPCWGEMEEDGVRVLGLCTETQQCLPWEQAGNQLGFGTSLCALGPGTCKARRRGFPSCPPAVVISKIWTWGPQY